MGKKSVEITVPVFNEEKELEENIKTLHDFCTKNLTTYDWQITIADNASTDATPSLAKNLEKKLNNVHFLRIEEKGRGRAVKQAWIRSDRDFCVYMDLDLSSDLKHLPNLLQALENGYDIAIGSRLAQGAKVEGRTFIREIVSRTLNLLFIGMLFHVHITDAQCGFKAVTKKVVKSVIPHVKDNEWFFDGELLITSEKSGYKIFEEPIHWVDNPGSTVRLISTISNDIQAMIRLFVSRPWKNM